MEFEDLKVYQKLFDLSHRVYEITLSFPKFELYELGSQLRRSSNSAPANLAEGFGNKHTSIYLECISRSKGEMRETRHHLRVANKRKYIDQSLLECLCSDYNECSRMLYGLEVSLSFRSKK